MIYLDSSALLKLVFEEDESARLEAWIEARADDGFVSSELAKVEVLRSCRRIDAVALPAARALLSGIDLVPISRSVVDGAAELDGGQLRSLDAIHLSSVLSLGRDVVAMVAYDRRLLDAASGLGLVVEMPGR